MFPVLIANQKGYAAKRLDAFERDITQLAILELHREWAAVSFRLDGPTSSVPQSLTAREGSALSNTPVIGVPWRAFPVAGSNRTARRKLMSTMLLASVIAST
jgi:hypothetical protein